jgi:hypothetical protein
MEQQLKAVEVGPVILRLTVNLVHRELLRETVEEPEVLGYKDPVDTTVVVAAQVAILAGAAMALGLTWRSTAVPLNQIRAGVAEVALRVTVLLVVGEAELAY